MGSSILEKMGLGSLDLGLIAIILTVLVFILMVMCIVLTVELCKLKKRYERFSGGRDAKSLEKEIGGLFIENAALRDLSEKNKKDIRSINKRMETAFQKIGLVKYDAFAQMGGKMSFSLALLDEKDNGFIINSIHGGDGCYSYIKNIKAGKCDLTLGEEEEKALKTAMHEE